MAGMFEQWERDIKETQRSEELARDEASGHDETPVVSEETQRSEELARDEASGHDETPVVSEESKQFTFRRVTPDSGAAPPEDEIGADGADENEAAMQAPAAVKVPPPSSFKFRSKPSLPAPPAVVDVKVRPRPVVGG